LFISWFPGVGRGHNRETVFTYVYIEKNIFFSRTSGPISMKLSINHALVKGIPNYLNKGPGPLQRGDNYKIAKMVWDNLKIFSRTTLSNSMKLDSNHAWVKGIINCTNKRPSPLQKGDNHKNSQMGWGHLKVFFSRTTEPEELIFIWKLSDILQI
jgi:hypothetical protein